MSTLQIILILIAAVIVSITVNVFAIKAFSKEKKKRKELEQALENQKKNLIYIVRHAQELAEIDKNRSKVDIELSEAKSDEEVVNIINTIIDANNNRVRNDKNK